MNRSATINGIRYEYVNKIKDINSSNTVVLCRDEHGCFCYCDADTWIASVQGESESSQVEQKSEGNGTSDERAITFNKYASPKDKIALFRYLFVGREDVYSKRYYSKNTGKSGYVPACGNEWVQGVCDKKQYKCVECPNRSFLPLTDDVLYMDLRNIMNLVFLPDRKYLTFVKAEKTLLFLSDI